MTPTESDAQDPLAHFRARFLIDDPDLIYLDGNSLGRMPLASAERVKQATEKEWGGGLVRGWHDWYDAPIAIGAKIAKLIGAEPDEVVVADSTTVNFFKLVVAALLNKSGRKKIVTDDLNFPSDLYALQGAMQTLGQSHTLQILQSRDRLVIEEKDLEEALDDQTALLTTSHISFKSGFVHDMARTTDLAHRAGALALWDLSHSVGAMPIHLGNCGADLAVGCTYKYLNGGPGAPAFLYVRRDLQEKLQSPLWGWFGQKDAFGFQPDYEPRPGIAKFLVGTPPILSLLAIEAGVDLVLEAGLEDLRSKSVAQTERLIELWETELKPFGVTLNSPRDSARRGSHVSFGHPEAWRINKVLIEQMNVIPDFRAPDNIRFGVTPLYTTFAELDEAVARFRAVLEKKHYEDVSSERSAVT
jgi:kynureninase